MSAKTAARLTRILTMLPWVIAHPEATVPDVCERFGYTESQLLADLDLVFVCGLPGYGPGDLMVAYVEDDRVIVDTADYFAAAPRLSAAESLALLSAGLTVLSAGQGTPELESAVAKLRSSLLPGEEEMLSIETDAEPEIASELRGAAADGRVIEIEYTSISRNETTVRQIEPWSIFTSLGNWYVEAYCRSSTAKRTFRLDRIRRTAPTDQRFEPVNVAEPPAISYTPAPDDAECTIDLDPAARWVVEYYPVEILDEGTSEGADTRIRFSAADPDVAARLLLRLGGTARLVEGDDVRVARDRLAETVLSRYRSA